jgi:hypothetical protein
VASRTYDRKTDFPQPGSPSSRIETIATSRPSIDAAIISRCANVEVDELSHALGVGGGVVSTWLGIELTVSASYFDQLAT